MPLTRISLRAGTTDAYRAALVAGVYDALRETFAVPEGDLFALVHQHDAPDFAYGSDYLGIERSDRLVIVQITANATRGTTQKRALYAAVTRNLARDPGLAPSDVFINLVEVDPENWSFGNGLMQYGPSGS
ncbi:tautomerase family protein [Methylobacterium sp. P5_C11]